MELESNSTDRIMIPKSSKNRFSSEGSWAEKFLAKLPHSGLARVAYSFMLLLSAVTLVPALISVLFVSSNEFNYKCDVSFAEWLAVGNWFWWIRALKYATYPVIFGPYLVLRWWIKGSAKG